MITDEYSVVTGEYKKKFIENILEGMTPFLNNQQLTELNKSLNKHTTHLNIHNKPEDLDLNYEEDNEILIKKFIKAKKLKGLSPRTLNQYERALIHFKNYNYKSFKKTTTEDIKEYLQFYQQLNNCSKITLNNVRRFLSSFYQWLAVEEYIIINPMDRIPNIKTPKRVKKAYSYAEVEKLRYHLETHEDKHRLRNQAIFELLISSGIRVSELVNLQINDIDLDETKGVVTGKGNKQRIIYFSERAKEFIQNYLETRDDEKEWLFLNNANNKLTVSGVETMIRKLGQRAGVTNVHPHRFRRTFATNVIRKGMPIDQVRILLGHNNLDTTMGYIESNKEQLKLVHNKHLN